MAQRDDRPAVSRWFALGVLLVVVVAIAVVVALSLIPTAERPRLQVVTTVQAPP